MEKHSIWIEIGTTSDHEKLKSKYVTKQRHCTTAQDATKVEARKRNALGEGGQEREAPHAYIYNGWHPTPAPDEVPPMGNTPDVWAAHPPTP